MNSIEKVILQIGYVPDLAMFTNAVELVVDTNVFMPSMFTVLLEDKVDPVTGLCPLIDNALKYKIGDPITVSVIAEDLSSPGVPKANKLFDGEVTSIEPIFDRNGRAMLRIRGYDRAHRLTRGKQTHVFGDGNPLVPTMTDMQIVSTIARNAGLTPVIIPTGLAGVMYSYVMQCNQTNWDFLWSRAQMLGYQVYVEGRSLYFTPAKLPRSVIPPKIMTWGENLVKFEPRLVSMGQLVQAQAMGWNPKLKQAMKFIFPAVTPKNPIGELLTGPLTIRAAFQSTAEDVVINPGAQMPAIAKAMAQARLEAQESQFIRASGELQGCDPFLTAGSMVVIKGVGLRFSGMYHVTEVRHVWRSGSYSMTFQVTGQNPYTMRSLLMGKEANTNRIDGVVIGIVTSINDPEMLGRVRVSFPWLPTNMGASIESNWARVAVPSGGSGRGIFFTPELNDEVLVAFEHGDINYPYIVGALWNTKDRPPMGAGPVVDPSGKVNQRIVRSRAGHTIILDDTTGREQIIIKDKSTKNSIVIDSVMNAMTIHAEGNLTIEAGGKLEIKSRGDFTLSSQTKGSITAQTTVEMSGNTGAAVKAGQSQLDLNAGGAALKGLKVDVQASTQASIQGNAMVQIQGALVKIN